MQPLRAPSATDATFKGEAESEGKGGVGGSKGAGGGSGDGGAAGRSIGSSDHAKSLTVGGRVYVASEYEYYPSELLLLLPSFIPCWRCVGACLDARALFTYVGERDAEGRPHGYGQWRDTQLKGEVLKGLWRHGVPIGPFISAEQGSGFGFLCVQIGFATCTSDPDEWDATRGSPIASPSALHWGIAAAETSVNGQFYRHLPQATLIVPPTAGKCSSLRSRVARTTHHVSRITYHVSRITHRVSRITYHLPRIAHHLSRII